MSEPNLDHVNGYLAVHAFLNLLWERNDPSRAELGMLLGSMSLLNNGIPADQGYVQDWDEALESATGRMRGEFSPEEIYSAMVALLRTYASRGAAKEFGHLIAQLDTSRGASAGLANPTWRDWLGCVAAAETQQIDPYLRLEK